MKRSMAIPALIALMLILAPSSSQGQWVGQQSSNPTTQEEALEEVNQPFSDTKPIVDTATAEDYCDWNLEGQEIQEQSQEVLRSMSCHSFRWFDGWWGDEEDFNEKAVNGWVTMGADYRKYDGIDPRMRLRVRAPLPNMSKRFDVMFGRVDESYISDTQGQDQTFYNPGVVNRGVESSWLLGLGHRRKSLKKGWDWSAGVRLRWPPEPYAKVSYFYNTQFSENSDLRFRQTLFWRSDEGFGTTSRGDLAWGITAKDVMRWEGIVRLSEETEGARWYVGQTWYHLLGNRSAFSLLAFVRGETSAPVSLTDFGLNFIWRRPFTRDWMYISMGPNITWPREYPEEERELNLGFGVWLEMEFGNWRY